MINSSNFHYGQEIFLVGYHDKELRFMFVEAYAFIKHESRGNENYWIIQDANNFIKCPARPEDIDHKRGVTRINEKSGIDLFLDKKNLIKEMQNENLKKNGR